MWNKITKTTKLAIFITSIIIFSICTAYFTSIFGGFSLLIVPILIAGFLLVYWFTKNPFLGFLFIIFFLPFERIPSFDIGLFTLKINQFLGGLLLISWILFLMFKKQKIVSNALTWPVILFLLTGFLSIFGAEFQSRALSIFIFILFTVLLFFLTVNMIDSKEKLKIVIKILLYSTLITCLFALYQFIGNTIGLPDSITGLKEGYGKEILGFPRVQAFSQEPLYLANFLFIPLGIFAGLFIEKIDFIKRKWLLGIVGLIVFVIILTVSRGAYLGLLAFIAIFALLAAKKVFSIKHIIIGITILAIIVCSVVFVMKKTTPIAYERFIGHIKIENYDIAESTQGRLHAWYNAYDAYQEKPLLGIGLGNFGPWVKGYPDPSTVEGWDIVNNEYLEILAETGILGAISFAILLMVLMIRSFIAYCRAKDKFLKAILVGLIAATIAILVQYNFFSTLYIIHIWILFGLFVVVQNLILNKKDLS